MHGDGTGSDTIPRPGSPAADTTWEPGTARDIHVNADDLGWHHATLLNIIKSPTSDEVVAWADKLAKNSPTPVDELRYGVNYHTGDTYVWDGEQAIHAPVMRALGLGGRNVYVPYVNTNSDDVTSAHRYTEHLTGFLEKAVDVHGLEPEKTKNIVSLRRESTAKAVPASPVDPWMEAGKAALERRMREDNKRKAQAIAFFAKMEILQRFYSPDQERDYHGRWTNGGGGVSDAAAQGKPAQSIADQLAHIQEKGGITYQMMTNESPAPGDPVLSVSAFPEREVIVKAENLTPALIAQYYMANVDALTKPGNSFGVWHDTETGKVFLDVVVLAKSKDEAISIGSKYNQIAAFDFKTMSTVDIKPERRANLSRSDSDGKGSSGNGSRQKLPGQGHDPTHVHGSDRTRADAGRNGGTESHDGVCAHGQRAKNPAVSRQAFSRALARCDFSVIDHTAERILETRRESTAKAVARAVANIITPANVQAFLKTDAAEIGMIDFNGNDRGKIKAACKAALLDAWNFGHAEASRELTKAKIQTPKQFSNVNQDAMGYLEANGFRMAGNLSDGARSIIQQQLLAAIRGDKTVGEARLAIYENLMDKGFTDLDSLDSVDTADVQQALTEAFGTDNVPAYLNTLIRTNIFDAMNQARLASFRDPDVADFIEAIEYSAILDDHTTQLCESLDGSIWTEDNPIWETYTPPNHYNCRSVVIPVTKHDGWDGVESDQPTLEPQDGFK
jgi:SPP1 gp7 family putative phage head morphogenesis protein